MVNPVRSEKMFETHVSNYVYKTEKTINKTSNFVFEAKEEYIKYY